MSCRFETSSHLSGRVVWVAVEQRRSGNRQRFSRAICSGCSYRSHRTSPNLQTDFCGTPTPPTPKQPTSPKSAGGPPRPIPPGPAPKLSAFRTSSHLSGRVVLIVVEQRQSGRRQPFIRAFRKDGAYRGRPISPTLQPVLGGTPTPPQLERSNTADDCRRPTTINATRPTPPLRVDQCRIGPLNLSLLRSKMCHPKA